MAKKQKRGCPGRVACRRLAKGLGQSDFRAHGGDYATVDHVAELLYQIQTQLDPKKAG